MTQQSERKEEEATNKIEEAFTKFAKSREYDEDRIP